MLEKRIPEEKTALPELSLRPVEEGDTPFLREMFGDTRALEVTYLEGSEADKQAFLDLQFALQSRSYWKNNPDGRFDIILLGETPIGRLYVNRSPYNIHIIDITLHNRYQRQGIGSRILKSLQNEAGAFQGSLSIMVEDFNPAVKLYERLGFGAVETHGVHIQMRWPSRNAEPTPVTRPTGD
ncbi:MAG: GNAT family N-acetyltransferase [Magnetococcales bacterium]|nr:GNAT family N-acetyltransferase [Magnetococcales bacterium]